MIETDEEKRVREEHLRELVRDLVRSGALRDEVREYKRDYSGVWRELTPEEVRHRDED